MCSLGKERAIPACRWRCRFCLRTGQGQAVSWLGSVSGCHGVRGTWSPPKVVSPLPWKAQRHGSFSFTSCAFLKQLGFLQIDIVTNNVSGRVLVGSTWAPVGLTTASEFAAGLSQSPLFQRKGERRGEGKLVGADHGLLHVPLPVPVTLNTSCLPPSPANFPNTRHCHWAKPREFFETLPCTQSQIPPSCQRYWPGKRYFFPYQGTHTPSRLPCETMPLFTL